MLLGALLYKLGKLRYLTARQDTKNTTTHTTTNMSGAALPTSGFGPLPPWVGQRHHQLMAPPLPMGPCKAHTIGLGGTAVGILVWGVATKPIKR